MNNFCKKKYTWRKYPKATTIFAYDRYTRNNDNDSDSDGRIDGDDDDDRSWR